MTREQITKGWKVVARDKQGKHVQLSRTYHSRPAAVAFGRLAEDAGYVEVEVREVVGYDRRDRTPK